jgi:hypothetical protein
MKNGTLTASPTEFTRLRRHILTIARAYGSERSGRSTNRYAFALPASSPPNRIPWANGNSVEKLIVFVWRRM